MRNLVYLQGLGDLGGIGGLGGPRGIGDLGGIGGIRGIGDLGGIGGLSDKTAFAPLTHNKFNGVVIAPRTQLYHR